LGGTNIGLLLVVLLAGFRRKKKSADYPALSSGFMNSCYSCQAASVFLSRVRHFIVKPPALVPTQR